MPKTLPRFAVFFAIFCALMANVSADPANAQSQKIWRAFASGQLVGLMRHAKAPGNKEPGPVSLWDCSTQRNLSGAGRAQARRTGAYLRRRGISGATIYSSQFCRCADTARLLGLGSVWTDSRVNALQKGAAGSTQTAGLRSLIANAATGSATIIVTHKTNIRAVTGRTPGSGETLLVNRRGRVVARISAR